MDRANRPRRSILYMPGSNPRALDKGRSIPCDGLILDLEDAVAPDAKVAARGEVVATIKKGGYGHRELFFRTNALSTPWGYEDLVAAASSGAHAVLLPKVESGDAVRQAVSILEGAGAPAEQSVWCMMETPRGVLRAEEIAGASPRVGGFVMGTSDMAKDLSAAHTAMRLPLLVALGQCLLVARAYGLPILDGVYLDLEDEAGFRASCVQGRELGFDGKTLIHPKTVAVANEVFAPSDSEVLHAKKIIAAFDEATRAGKGVVVVDGKLVENLHVETARRLVSRADAIAAS